MQCRDINELRTLLTTPDLDRHVVRLHLDMTVSLSEENEVERILRDLQGTDATHGRAGILLVDRTNLRLQPGSDGVFPDDLPAGGQGHHRAPRPHRSRPRRRGREGRGRLGRWRTCTSCFRATRPLLGRGAMKIRRLRVNDFAAIREADIEFGPGLNVLYGPNDLGKSTLADAIRLALLLPHTSTPHRGVRSLDRRPESRRRADLRNRSRSASGG